jgi:phosphoribosylcarboxyaminoimidazole (NCAIR) mutase
VFSSLRMPSGIAPAVVLDPGNAALLAAKILGVGDATVRDAVTAFQRRQAARILDDDQAVAPASHDR